MKHEARIQRAEAQTRALPVTDAAAPCPDCGLPRNRTVFTSIVIPSGTRLSLGTHLPAPDFRAECETCASTRMHVRFVRRIVRPDPAPEDVSA